MASSRSREKWVHTAVELWGTPGEMSPSNKKKSVDHLIYLTELRFRYIIWWRVLVGLMKGKEKIQQMKKNRSAIYYWDNKKLYRKENILKVDDIIYLWTEVI